MTYSLVGRCDRTGAFGAIVSSSSPAVGGRCAYARPGVGAACSQNATDPSLGPKLLDALCRAAAPGALAEVVSSAPHIEYRQLSLVGTQGHGAVFSGRCALGRAASATGPACAAAGNLLANTSVPDAMVEMFAADTSAELGDRLLAALFAGRDAGGEETAVRSAGMLVVDTMTWPTTDLRIDWSNTDPAAELAELWRLWKPQVMDYVTRALDPGAAPNFGVVNGTRRNS